MRFINLASVALTIGLCTFIVDSAKILGYFPVPSISHQVVFRPLIHELAKRGHQVTVITPDPVYSKGQAPPNLTEIDVHDLSYVLFNELHDIEIGSKSNPVANVAKLIDDLGIIIAEQVKTKEVQEIIKNGSFDLLIVENGILPLLHLAKLFNVPAIQISSVSTIHTTFIRLGAPTHSTLYPSILETKLNDLTVFDKTITVLKDGLMQLGLTFYFPMKVDEFTRKIFGPMATHTVNDLLDTVALVMLNVHPLWESNRPVPPNIIFLGSFHLQARKPMELPKDLKTFLDTSKNGVIYVSFGSNIRSSVLPPESVDVMKKVFSKMTYDVIWKWDNDTMSGKPENVRLEKWLPQADLLRHPSIKLFVTQGGMQSIDEAIAAEVPMLGIPMFGDQYFNVERCVQFGIGVRVDIDIIDEESFQKAIMTVIMDESYRENIVRLKALMEDQPQTPLDRAVWWTEHVLRHRGAKHLRASSFNVSWSEYLMLDVILALILLCIVVPTIVLILLQKAVKKML